jgi:sigma-E factor negative regulatory protein RseA
MTTASASVPEPAQDDERLSAWIDGELDPGAAGQVIDGLLRNGAQREHYARWCMIGDALRSNEVAAEHAQRLCGRIVAAIENEPALFAPRALPLRVKRQLASGLAVAAAVAVLAVVALPQLRDGLSGVGAPATGGASAAASGPTGNGSAVAFNVLHAAPHAATHNPLLEPYLRAHRDFTGAGVMPAAAVYLRSGSETER